MLEAVDCGPLKMQLGTLIDEDEVGNKLIMM